MNIDWRDISECAVEKTTMLTISATTQQQMPMMNALRRSTCTGLGLGRRWVGS
ncbi:hypothetical protein BLC1_0431 [Bifidobacterium animalis subsp. lactis BLC1]|jgi:hypothetical protein|nr:hypothetical protein BLC1_0431 [Bifidobacterium animalis subsp. lactis BLC1]AGO51935.1 hypothetical protein Bl12_0417 [Bifidobacterium animalis subsp. lactis Bl12]KOA45911.1 hypothetical protein BAAA27536_04995 [Bifidobacterium animalis subsp. lactis ATCC 27536]KOA47260.1 hypothetical protein BAAA27673_04285 [Bifidobacterium animalis subsp. lactis ATCC 27673]KOA51466.1 hypothetical protein BAAA27674_04385 [Bifidobacterium animalis subsp. lactis ATCC 27674]